MGRVISWNIMTLDGYFEGKEPWDLGVNQLVWGEELEAFSLELLAEADALLFGRKTYEGMASYWSKETGKVADGMNSLPKLVVSRSLQAVDWNNSTLLKGEVQDAVRSRKQQGDKPIYVFGSANLLDTLLRHGLVDEYRICLAPVVTGTGTPLFKPGSGGVGLELLSAQALRTGGVVLRYAVKPRS